MQVKSLPKTSKSDFLFGIKDVSEKTRDCFKWLLLASGFANKHNKILLGQAGFAVDLAVGKLTRNHDDLDLITLEEEIEDFRNYFINQGFKIGCLDINDPSLTFMFGKGLVHGDMDTINVDGEDVSDRGDKDDDRWTWPIKASELIWSRTIDNILVKFASPVLVYDFKKRQQRRDKKREKENQDLAVLEQYFPYLKDYEPK